MALKKRKIILIAGIFAIIIVWAMGQYDYAALVAGKRPVFARCKMYPADGGSVEYWGFGYTVTQMHRLSGGLDPNNPTMRAYQVGPTLTYWTPFVSRDSIWFIETNNFTNSGNQ